MVHNWNIVFSFFLLIFFSLRQLCKNREGYSKENFKKIQIVSSHSIHSTIYLKLTHQTSLKIKKRQTKSWVKTRKLLTRNVPRTQIRKSKETNKKDMQKGTERTLEDLVEDLESRRAEDEEVGVAGRQSEAKLAGESKLEGATASENLEGKESSRFGGR